MKATNIRRSAQILFPYLFVIVVVLQMILSIAKGETLDLNLKSNALQKQDSYLVSINSTGQRHHWAEDLCQVIHAGLNTQSFVNTTCHRLTGAFLEKSVQEARASGDFIGQISIEKIEFPNVLVTINDWRPQNKDRVQTVSYKMDFTDEEKFFTAMHKLTRNLRNFELHKDQIIQKIDQAYDSDPEQKTQVFKGEQYLGKQNYRRMILEVGAAFGFAAYWYYSDSTNENDWQFSPWQGAKDKVTGVAIRYDDNSKVLNVGHAFAGMSYQQLARANGLTQRQAFLSSFLLSAAWESIIEYREILSINDMIHTGLSGPVIGEVFYQMARSLRSRNSLFAKAFGVLLDGPSAANQWLDRNKNLAKHEAQYEDSLKLELGLNEFGFSGEVWSLPEGEKVAAFLPQGFQTNMNLGVRWEGKEISEFQLLTKIAFMGYMKRNMRQTGENEYEGYEFIISPASEFEWVDRPLDNNDFLIHARVLGGTVRLTALIKGFQIKASYEFYGDFAMLRSYALEEYKKGNSLAGFPGIVQREEYYYGWGTTQKAGLSVGRGRATIGVDYQTNDIQATQSRDRYQELVTKNFRANDTFDRLKFWFQFQLTPRLTAEISTEKTDRAGSLYAYRSQSSERITTGRIIYKF